MPSLVARASPAMDDLSLEEMREGAARLREKILRYQPRFVCFNGKRIFRRLRSLLETIRHQQEFADYPA